MGYCESILDKPLHQFLIEDVVEYCKHPHEESDLVEYKSYPSDRTRLGVQVGDPKCDVLQKNLLDESNTICWCVKSTSGAGPDNALGLLDNNNSASASD